MAKGHIEVNETLCKGCELCVPVCPYNLIQMGSYYNAKGYKPAVAIDPDGRCTGCTLCAMICPDAVITVYRNIKIKQAPVSLSSVAAL